MHKISIKDFIKSLSDIPEDVIVIVDKDIVHGKDQITGLPEKTLRLSAIMHIKDVDK